MQLIEPRNDDMSQLWLYCILPMIGERFQYSDEIVSVAVVPRSADPSQCGAVLSFRPKRKSIALWNRDASKREVCDKTEADLRTFLKLHTPTDIRYQSHSVRTHTLRGTQTALTSPHRRRLTSSRARRTAAQRCSPVPRACKSGSS